MNYSHDYTINEITAMAAGAEMDAAIATTFFGWRWMKYQSPNSHQPKLLTGIFPPPAEGRKCVSNDYDLVWLSSDRHAPRFSDWYRVTWWEDNFAECKEGAPHYSTDTNEALSVLAIYRDSPQRETDDFFAIVENLTGGKRWPDALFYVTAEIICRAALFQAFNGITIGEYHEHFASRRQAATS